MADSLAEGVFYYPAAGGHEVLFHPDGHVEAVIRLGFDAVVEEVQGVERKRLLQLVVNELTVQDRVWVLIDAYEFKLAAVKRLAAASTNEGDTQEDDGHPDRDWRSRAWFQSVRTELCEREFRDDELWLWMALPSR